MKYSGRLLVLSAALLALLLAGCEQKKEEGVRTTVYDKAKLAEEGKNAEALLPVQQQVYFQSVKDRLANLDERIGKLKEKVAGLPEASRSRYTDQLEEIRRERELTKEKFSYLQEAGSEAWTPAKEAVDAAISKLEEGVNQLTIELKKA